MEKCESIKISICIAAYNVEKYLEECIESVISQINPEVEVLIIDDASKDGTEAICRLYEERFPQLRVIRLLENQGLSGVRNTAIREARSPWLFFMDGDDILLPEAIQNMFYYVEDSADVIVFDCIEFYDGEKDISLYDSQHECFVLETAEELLKYRKIILGGRQIAPEQFKRIPFVSVWGKLLRREFFTKNKIWFDLSLRQSQDLQFSFNYSAYLRKIRFISRSIYGYRRNDGSVTKRFSDQVILRKGLLMQSLRETLKKEGLENWELLKKEYYCRALYELADPIMEQSIGHPKCPWSFREQCHWLRSLCELTWVKELLQEYPDLPVEVRTKYKNLIILLMKKRYFGLLDIVIRVRICIKQRKQ